MNHKLKNRLLSEIENSLKYDEDAWSTAAFNIRIEQYRLAFSSKNGRDPSQDEINKFARLILKEDWVSNGEKLYRNTFDEIASRLLKILSRYVWRQTFKDRIIATSIITISIFTGYCIYEKQEITSIYGAVSISAIVALIFGVKIIWNSISFKE